MGPEIIVISGFRNNNRGQKSADLVISEPRNNSSFFQPLRTGIFLLLDTTSHQVSHVTTANTVPGMILVCCTRHASPTTKNHKHTYDSILRLCARQSFILTQTRQQQHHHHRNHHSRHTTPAPQKKQRSRRDRSRGGGDLTSPATVYVPDFKNKSKR